METYKTLKFDSNLVPGILSGDKTSTWRLFDDKDLKVGDNLILIDKETGKEFSKAVITEVDDREIQNIRESDYDGHDKFESSEAALEAFRKHYGLSVTPTSILKIVRFKLVQEKEVKIIKKFRNPTKEADDLKKSLEDKGVRVLVELHDGHKHIDLAIPKARINVEVDGIQHLTNPQQILADLNRGYYSHQNGYNTMHIPNEMIRLHLKEISEALAEASKIREKKLRVHVE